MVFKMIKNADENFTPLSLIIEYQKEVSVYYDLAHGKYSKIMLVDKQDKKAFVYDHWSICDSTISGKIAVFVYMREVSA